MSIISLPVRYNLAVYRGDDLVRTFAPWYRLPDGTAAILDTTGWTGRMQVRPDPDSSVVLVEATTANGYLTTGIQGSGDRRYALGLHIPGAVLGADRLPAGLVAVYDIELADTAGHKQTFYYGTFRVDGDVTR